MKARIETFFENLKLEMSENEIAAGLGNGDIEKPEWLCISESTDHLKVWDGEDGMSSTQMGFYTVDYK